jgi:thiamine pyrophosphate-dependent acetolactate synthase large subunit-like protein
VHPHVASQFARERHREMLAQAEQQRLARQLVKLARASRRAERAERRMRQALRKALRLRSELEQ